MNGARRPLIAGNWKMNLGGPEAITLADEVVRASKAVPGVDVVVCPPFTALAAVAPGLEESRVGLGAQNLHPKASGAFTGEVSAPMLVAAGCTWVILGHSERRQFFGDTDTWVAEKTAAAFAAKLAPIVCIGELESEREAGKTLEVLERQVKAVLPVLAANAEAPMAIAYEPVWAIGTGKAATAGDAEEAHAFVRKLLANASETLAARVRVLYGGSVTGANARELLACPNVDGALVGGASLALEKFEPILAAAQALTLS
jgi:triosephosphate isomerase